MTKEMRLLLRKPKSQGKCLYDWNGVIVIEISAMLSLPFFVLARNDASDDWLYIFCIAAAIVAMIIAIRMRYLPMIIREVPILLYAVFYIAGTYLSFDRAKTVEQYMMPAFILSGVRLVAGITMMILALSLPSRKDSFRICRYWYMMGNACMFCIISDVIMCVAVLFTLNVNILMGTGLYELTIRMFGEFWLSVAALIAIQPQYLTINYHKVNSLLRDYLGVIPWIALILAAIMLIVSKEVISVRILVWGVALFDVEILVFKQARRRFKADSKLSYKASKNYIKVFCTRKWFYTYYDVVDILSIQQRLENIKAEQEFLEKGIFTDYAIGRLNALDEEEWNLLMKLELRYTIPIRFPVEP